MVAMNDSLRRVVVEFSDMNLEAAGKISKICGEPHISLKRMSQVGQKGKRMCVQSPRRSRGSAGVLTKSTEQILS